MNEAKREPALCLHEIAVNLGKIVAQCLAAEQANKLYGGGLASWAAIQGLAEDAEQTLEVMATEICPSGKEGAVCAVDVCTLVEDIAEIISLKFGRHKEVLSLLTFPEDFYVVEADALRLRRVITDTARLAAEGSENSRGHITITAQLARTTADASQVLLFRILDTASRYNTYLSAVS